MDDQRQFQRLAGVAALLAAVVALGSAALSVAAVGGNTQAYIDYSLAGFAPGGAEIYRYGGPGIVEPAGDDPGQRLVAGDPKRD